MSKLQYTIVGGEDGSSWVTVFVPGASPQVAHSSHPNFDQIVAGVTAGDESVVELFDIAQTAATKFERLTERVTTKNGKLYLDGEEVHNELSAQVVRFLAEGVDDWKPLVNFFEKVQTNPSEHSREQLYSWLANRKFTITDDGNLVGYKGVRPDGDQFVSIMTGKALVDGVLHEGHIPNYVGAIVEMPRGDVEFNPAVGCHTGLHVGTYEYANDFAQGALLEVHVNPRDVVSVPTDCDAQKMRVCRYQAVSTIDAPHTAAVVRDYAWNADDQDDFWGDGEGDDDYLWCHGDHGDDVTCEDCGTGLGTVDPFARSPRAVDPNLTKNPVVAPNAPTSGYGVSIGDQFEDQDTRRPRTLEVVGFGEDVANNEVMVKNVSTGKLSSINALRLLTAYRFRKV